MLQHKSLMLSITNITFSCACGKIHFWNSSCSKDQMIDFINFFFVSETFSRVLVYHIYTPVFSVKARKCPTLDEQPRGPDGRIIFSEEYIDFMLYRDLQPLVDLRILKHTEIIIQERIRERDAAKKGNLLDCVQVRIYFGLDKNQLTVPFNSF